MDLSRVFWSRYTFRYVGLFALSGTLMLASYLAASVWQIEQLQQLQGIILLVGFFALFISATAIFKQMIKEIATKTRQLEIESDQIKLMLDISAIANESKTPRECLIQSLERVCRHSSWVVGNVFRVSDSDEELLIPTTCWHADDFEHFRVFQDVTNKMRLRMGEGLPGRALAERTAIWVEDVTTDGNLFRNEIAKEIGIRSSLAFPVFANNKVAAVVEFFSERKLEKNEQLLEVASHVGEQLARVFERESYEATLRKERDLARTANQSKTYFLANISHELRTPLHGILGFADLGKERAKTATTEKILSYFEEIRASGSHLLNLLNELLDFAKLESGKVVYSMVEADMIAISRLACSEMSAFAEQRRLKIDVGSTDTSAKAYFDPQKINQVIMNLLSNAIKFSTEGTLIKLLVLDEPTHIKCIVSNHGVGIPRAELSSIFDKFVQGSRTRSGAGGTGLGLSICKEIVEHHHGRIWAESDSEETRFVVEIPKSIG